MEASDVQVPNAERVRARDAWLARTNTRIDQVNGQRKYGGPPEGWEGPAPGPNCEVFIRNIPRDLYEDRLIPLFRSAGPLWEFRLMMNFSGQNRGFAYAKYGSPQVAADAIRQLHGVTLEPDFRVAVCRSVEKRRLRVTFSQAVSGEGEFFQMIAGIAEGVESLSLNSGCGRNDASAVVVFSSHHAASMAKKVLAEEFMRRFALRISVMWMPPFRTSKRFWPRLPAPPHECSRHSAGTPPAVVLPSSSPSFGRAAGRSADPEATPRGNPPALTVLHQICVAIGVGFPHFEFFVGRPRPDGFLDLTYRVSLPGVGAFSGLLIVPEPASAATLEVVQEAAAHRALRFLEALNLLRRSA
ncbi:dead end protein 1-like [Syngnathoides biaculeatus]|uniref:dead end protein 1-like n=1 Tax=Syngnathoides biaculeatus TaxID=300417 RepID=UPI002ADE3FAB|nr:dead end protein 1-like [Syngnathoides biaculeatus]